MSIQNRNNALQNEVVRLYCTFNYDGVLKNPSSQPSVNILDTDGVYIIDTIPAQEDSTGVWYVDWFVPADLPLGNYYDQWNYQMDSYSSVKERTMLFSVFSLDSYVNFLSKNTSTAVSSRSLQLLLELENNFIYEAQHIPIYSEQGMRMQQDNQSKRIKQYYYFHVNEQSVTAYKGDVYSNNGYTFTVTKDFNYKDFSSSSSHDVTVYREDISEINYLSCTGSGDPLIAGVLTKVSGQGSNSIGFNSLEKKKSYFSTIFNFAYSNWNPEFRPIVRLNNRIVDDGWHADYSGKIYFDSYLSPEDSVSATYTFSYFSVEELLSFLNLGLKMMNGLPPSSEYYSRLENSPRVWDAGILLYAACTALKRLIFGSSWQEKRIIYGSMENAQSSSQLYQDLYKSYMETWTAFGKDVKSRKLPSMALYVTPEYTLPGGRSRWFRYLYKGG